MDRSDFFFKQKVKSTELDGAFEQVENAVKALLTDVGITGILSGGNPQPESPASLSIELAVALSAYDKEGNRLQIPDAITTVDCSVDANGAPTAVNTPGNERYLGIFIAHKRIESDPRLDGNQPPQAVNFLLTDSFEVRVRQGVEALSATGVPVALREDEILACDVILQQGTTQITAGLIDTSRREDLLFLTAENMAVDTTGWTYFVAPSPAHIQDALDRLDTDLGGHFGGTSLNHPATDVTYAGAGFIAPGDVSSAFSDVVSEVDGNAADLASTTINEGANFVGLNAGAVADNTPVTVATGSLQSVVDDTVSGVNDHIKNTFGVEHNFTTGAHRSIDVAQRTSLGANYSVILKSDSFRVIRFQDANFHIYYITNNAVWNATQWEKDDNGEPASAIALVNDVSGPSITYIRVLQQNTTPDTWASNAWTREAEMSSALGVFKLSDAITEGACGVSVENQTAGSREAAETVDFRVWPNAAPTTINLFLDNHVSWAGAGASITASQITTRGFKLSGTSDTVHPGGVLGYWHGYYQGS